MREADKAMQIDAVGDHSPMRPSQPCQTFPLPIISCGPWSRLHSNNLAKGPPFLRAETCFTTAAPLPAPK